MQVILTQDFHSVGQKGQAVSVKPGYFRNFLSPKGLAIAGTKKNLIRAEEVNKQIIADLAAKKEAAEELRDKLQATTIVLKEKLTKKGSLFAKISSKEIAEALANQATTEIPTNNILLKEAIKKTGVFNVNIKLDAGIVATIKLVVEGIEEEK